MIRISPVHLILIGGVLLLLGVVLPLLMVIKILPTAFALEFFSYAASVTGMFMGLIGAFSYVKEKRK